MRRRPCHALWLALLAVPFSLLATPAFAAPPDGGGHDVSVALFSTHTLRAVTLTPLGPHTWIARCAQCKHEPFTAPLHIAGPTEIFAGGLLRVTDDATQQADAAAGLWHLRAAGPSHEIDIVLTLPSERYVAAVLNAEAASGEPPQSLRTLAILARTYALNDSHYTAAPGHLPAELCDSTECQAMRLGDVSAAIDDATRATAGETLWFGSRRAEAFFSQNCGGLTEDGGAVWPTLRGLPYLRSHADPYCLRRDSAAWHAEVPLAKFIAIAQAEGWRMPTNIVAAHVIERSPSHRALRIAFTAANGVTSAVSASALRFGIGRALDWDRVRSDAYELGIRNGALVFDGHGHGHGVGLCQAGAAEMASEGKNAREILAFYFPGTAVRIVPGDAGWQQTQAGPLTLRATHPFSLAQKTLLLRTWSDAQQRFPPRRAITPEIIFAPTTELFRQLTAQPGWDLASTQGNIQGSTIVLQPESILRAHSRDLSATLLHEMLHALVESESSEQTPLWLREGLVEVLAGESPASSKPMPANAIGHVPIGTAAIDAALRNADSLPASERAHRAAAARVQALIARYGLSTVRGWLSSGVPASVG